MEGWRRPWCQRIDPNVRSSTIATNPLLFPHWPSLRSGLDITELTPMWFLVAKSNSIRGFVRWSVGPSVGPLVTCFSKTANSSNFNKIQQNSQLFATVGRVTALFSWKSNSIRGFVRWSVRLSVRPSVHPSVRPRFLKTANSSKFK